MWESVGFWGIKCGFNWLYLIRIGENKYIFQNFIHGFEKCGFLKTRGLDNCGFGHI